MPKVPSFQDVGKAVGDLLKGSPKSGAFQLDNKVSFSGVTSSGLTVSLSAVAHGDKVVPTLKAAYSKQRYSADATYDGTKCAVNVALGDVLLPGLKLSGSATLPDAGTSAKLSADYAFPYLSTKAILSTKDLTVFASTGVKDVIVGVEGGFDHSKSTVSKYNVALGYHAPDFQVAVSVLDKLQTLKVGYAQNVNASTQVGAEVVRKLGSGDTSVSLGYAKVLPSGALAKVKLDNTGLVSALYETKLAGGEKVGGSLQLRATDLGAPVKYGFALDLS